MKALEIGSTPPCALVLGRKEPIVRPVGHPVSPPPPCQFFAWRQFLHCWRLTPTSSVASTIVQVDRHTRPRYLCINYRPIVDTGIKRWLFCSIYTVKVADRPLCYRLTSMYYDSRPFSTRCSSSLILFNSIQIVVPS